MTATDTPPATWLDGFYREHPDAPRPRRPEDPEPPSGHRKRGPKPDFKNRAQVHIYLEQEEVAEFDKKIAGKGPGGKRSRSRHIREAMKRYQP